MVILTQQRPEGYGPVIFPMRALAVGCPKCGAEAESHCTADRDGEAVRLWSAHPERVAVAPAEYHFPQKGGR